MIKWLSSIFQSGHVKKAVQGEAALKSTMTPTVNTDQNSTTNISGAVRTSSKVVQLRPIKNVPTSQKSTPNTLKIDNLGKAYDGRPVVRGVSLSIKQGEAVGLLGPNGAGKTSTFYMIMGLIRPDYGTVKLNDQEITHLPVYQRARLGLGYLPQEASVFRGLNVEDNIMATLEVSEPIREKRSSILDSLLAEFSITHLRLTPTIALSGGERRRVEIARALASNPSFILLDEPLAGIDPVAVNDIKELISHLKDRGIGVLITDHNVHAALDLVDRAVIMYEGKVLVDGTPKDIVGNDEVRRVYLGNSFKLETDAS
jgi:lipopolysaccharide export system ATP-binding protein